MPVFQATRLPREVLVKYEALQTYRERGTHPRTYPRLPIPTAITNVGVGDPFLGGLLRAIGGGLKFIGKVGLSQLGLPQLTTGFEPPTQIPKAPRYFPGAGGMVLPGRGRKPGAYPELEPIQMDIPSGPRRRRRRMNPLNPRALKRALVRAERFQRFVSRTMQVTRRIRPKKGFLKRVPRRRR